MKNAILLLLITIGTQFVIAQDYDFRKVSKEELAEQFNPLDASASAAYLYKYRKTYFQYSQQEGFQLVTEIHERIKIYNKDGFDYATQEINLYKGGSKKEKVGNLKAYTYNLVNNEIEETKLKKDGIFDTELSKYYNQTKFTMPNIKEGTVIEYTYKITSPFVYNVDEFVFQHDIPVNKLEARFEAPEYFNFKVNTKGFLVIRPKNEKQRDKITFRSKTRSEWGIGSTTFSSSDLEFTKNITRYNLTNIPALKDEPYVNNIDNYRSAVKYELSFIKYPNSPIDYYATTWEDVVKSIYKNPSFGAELNKSGYYEKEVDALIASVTEPLKKAALLYNFVKSKVKWNKYHGKYTDVGVRKAYKEQVGNVAEINLMLTSMLRYAGLNANPILVSTRSHGIPLFPTREGYNYVICGIELPNDVILLDATSKFGSPNILPFKTLNWQGRIIRKQGSSALIDLYPKQKSKNTISLNINLEEEGNISGMIRSVKTNHLAMSYRNRYIGTNKDEFLEKLENKYNGMEISDFEIKNDLELSKPVMETYKFTLEDQAEIIGSTIYFSPLFFFATKENPFKLDKREFPVDFGFPSNTTYRINIALPEGYQVDTKPESKSIGLPDNFGSFKYVISAKESNIQLIVSYDINSAIIPSFHYDTLKEYFKQVIDKESEKIVLKKL